MPPRDSLDSKNKPDEPAGHIAIQVGETLRWDSDQERFLAHGATNALIDWPIHSPRR